MGFALQIGNPLQHRGHAMLFRPRTSRPLNLALQGGGAHGAFTWGVLDALLEAGLSPDHSCREGLCGACETRVLAGDVEHRDSILTESERAANKSMMICVSRCRSSVLVLDA